MPRYVQPQLPFPGLGFLSRKRKVVKTKGTTFKTGRTRGIAAPLGITFLGQRAARGKVNRARKKAS